MNEVINVLYVHLLLSCYISMVASQYQVTTIPNSPYTIINPNPSNRTKYVGMFIDILDEVSRRANFTYVINVVPDFNYGSEVRLGEWNGMIGQLVRNESDIAVAPLSIVSRRASAIRYTQPILMAGYRFLVKRPETVKPRVVSWLTPFNPFTWKLWTVIGFFFAVVSILFVLIGRFSPYEDAGLHKKAAGNETRLTLLSSFLYTASSLTLQGFSTAPRSLSGRTLAVSWRIFFFLTIVAYIANMTTLLATKEPHMDSLTFVNFEELSRQSRVTYGTIQFASTYAYFKYSTQSLEKRLWAGMNIKSDSFVNNMAEGIERVRMSQGKYAFIAGGPSLEYYAAQKPCDLLVLGESLSEHALAFACNKHSDICDRINHVLAAMKEEGYMYKIKQKWFTGECEDERLSMYGADEKLILDSFGRKRNTEKSINAVSVKQIGAVFAILAFSIVLSLFVMMGEKVFASYRDIS